MKPHMSGTLGLKIGEDFVSNLLDRELTSYNYDIQLW